MVARAKTTGAKRAAVPSTRDRFHLRVSRDVKDMLEQAAALATGGDVTAFVLGAAITPTPDPINQTIISLPIYFLFEIGILLARFA